MWQLGTAANAAVCIAYVSISLAILRPVRRERQLRSNPLATATAALFFTCAVHFGADAVRALLPALGLSVRGGEAVRATIGWGSLSWDVLLAAVGIYYWTLRASYAPLVRGAKLIEDMKEHQRRALEVNDDIVQGLYFAQTALLVDKPDVSEEALRTALESARRVVTDLVGEPGSPVELGPGDLVRRRAALTSMARP